MFSSVLKIEVVRCSCKWTLDGVVEPVLSVVTLETGLCVLPCPLWVKWQFTNITAKNLSPSCNIMMTHYDNENTNIEQQSDHKPHTEHLRCSLSPQRHIKMIYARAG